jgi:hypothetical protein
VTPIPHLLKTVALPALVTLTLAACGDSSGEIEKACLDAGNGTAKNCACMQDVADKLIEKDPKTEPLFKALASGDKSKLQAATQDYGRMESLGVIAAFGMAAEKQCDM